MERRRTCIQILYSFFCALVLLSLPCLQVSTAEFWFSRMISTDDSKYGTTPDIAMACDNPANCQNVHAVWVEQDPPTPDSELIYYRRSTDGGETWPDPPIQISQRTGFRAGKPSIAVRGSEIHVAWCHENEQGSTLIHWIGVYYQRSDDNGDTWLQESGNPKGVRIDDPVDGRSQHLGEVSECKASISLTDDHVHVVWGSQRMGESWVFYDKAKITEATDSTKWGAEQGEYLSIDVDEGGLVHMSYYDKTYRNLKYSYHWGDLIGGQYIYHMFLTQTVDALGDVGGYSSIVATGSGQDVISYISYYDATGGDLKVAKSDGWSWTAMFLDYQDNVGKYTSMAKHWIAPIYELHVVYYDVTNQRLLYQRTSNGYPNWLTKEVIDNNIGDVEQQISIAVDQDGKPHVSYYDDANKRLKYAFRSSANNWIGKEDDMKPDFVDTATNVGWHSSIAVDSGNEPHISYLDKNDPVNTKIKHAYWDGGNWVIEANVDTADGVGMYSSIVVDTDNDKVHISYYDESNKELKYAYKEDTSWHPQTVDNSGNNGKYSSIALNHALIDNPVEIGYTYNDVGGLFHPKCANLRGVIWTKDLVQTDEILSHRTKRWGGLSFPDIATDGKHVHVAFSHLKPENPSERTLYYRKNPNEGNDIWSYPQTVADDGLVRGLLDSSISTFMGNVHIAWSDDRGGSLAIYYRKSVDNGDSWPGSDTRISDDDPANPEYSNREPSIAVAGGTVHVIWKRVTFSPSHSDIFYDRNRVNGDPGKWGQDIRVAPLGPFPPEGNLYAESPEIHALGNDRHMVFTLGFGLPLRREVYYAQATDIVQQKGPLPSALEGASAVKGYYHPGNSGIYVIGGIGNSGYSKKVWRYRPSDGSFTEHCTLVDYPNGIAYTSSAYDPDTERIYVFGGLSPSGVSNLVIRINPDPDDPDCKQVTTMQPPRYGTSAVYYSQGTAKQGILIFGGQVGPDDYTEEILWYQPGVLDPVQLPLHALFSTARGFTSAVTFQVGTQNYAFVFGGETFSAGTTRYLTEIVRVYWDESLTDWENDLDKAAFPAGEGRSRTSATSDGTYTYIFGGLGAGDTRYEDIFRFNPRMNLEIAVVDICSNLPMQLESTSAVYSGYSGVMGAGSYVFGGGDPYTDMVLQYVASYEITP